MSTSKACALGIATKGCALGTDGRSFISTRVGIMIRTGTYDRHSMAVSPAGVDTKSRKLLRVILA